MNLFPALTPDARSLLNRLILLIDEVFPLPRRFRGNLPRDVADLSRLYTYGRGDRELSYLTRPNLLSAYLRYFLPWNVYRLCRLLPSLSLNLNDGDTVIDLGSGPLTLPLALWICRPDLRGLSLEFRCLDRAALALDAGEKIFAALSAKDRAGKEGGAWRIKTLRGEIDKTGSRLIRREKNTIVRADKTLREKPAALVSAVNVFNEIFWDLSPVNREGLENLAEQSAGLLGSLCAKNGTIFAAEPGIPRSGEFVSCFRSGLLNQGLELVSPCVHHGTCPFPGGLDSKKKKAKWCHFSFDTHDAPPELLKLSAAAGIPKERAVLSFLLGKKIMSSLQASPKTENAGERFEKARIISDSFPVGSSLGRYACSGPGALLVKGNKEKIGTLDSGACAEVKITNQRDPKSGALMGEPL